MIAYRAPYSPGRALFSILPPFLHYGLLDNSTRNALVYAKEAIIKSNRGCGLKSEIIASYPYLRNEMSKYIGQR